jgi:hypothetical protein
VTIRVGEVIGVRGTMITLRIDEESSKESLFFKGERFKGISIREYLAIQRGFRDIVCLVEGEYLDESRLEGEGTKVGYVRKIEARPIGYFEDGAFKQGIKFLPMIRDPAFLLQEERIAAIFGYSKQHPFVIGKTLKEELPIALPWQKLFNSHIGIFGNTGSGKSNTLTKLYTVLFEQLGEAIGATSRFVFVDFNGEYTGQQLAPPEQKTVYQLSTQGGANQLPHGHLAKFQLHPDEFWDTETLSLLFQATPNTQRPFLNRIIEGRRRFEANIASLGAYAKSRFRKAFCAAEVRPATLDLMRGVARLVENEALLGLLKEVQLWGGGAQRFWRNGVFFNADGAGYEQHIAGIVNTIDVAGLDAFKQLILRANLQLIDDLVHGYVQFEHIQPLLKRIESSLSSLNKVLEIGGGQEQTKLLTVISLRRCNNETKKVLPLLLAKHYYNAHKKLVATPPNSTIHLVIDEAHNILSEQSSREHESWKDYRLEQFEEIIKEGRKFGIFVTIASQRPADISPTIVSQLHNYFIHRLVNDRDLYLIENAITTLDRLSRSLIPNLPQGCCVVTGTSFELPVILQVDKLERAKQPDSEDVNLGELWAN